MRPGSRSCSWDERLSTVEAAGQLRRAGHDARGQKDLIDGAAAVTILQSWLDARRARASGQEAGGHVSKRARSGPGSRRSRAPASRTGPRWRVGSGVAVVVALLVIVVLSLPHKRKGGVGRAVDVEIAPGATDAEVIAKLEAAGVLDAPTVFSIYARTRGGIAAKPGRHLLSDDLSPVEVLRRLQRSTEAPRKCG